VSYRGGEKVLELLGELYPTAPIYTLFFDPRGLPEALRQRDIRYPSGLNRLRRLRKLLLPWLPAMIESLPLFDYDLIVSTSSCVAKGVLLAPGARHLCYIHSPMRYVWDERESYMQGLARLPFVRAALQLAATKLRLWDVVSAQRVDRFVANSSFVASRVERFYGRRSAVVHPPIDVDYFRPDEQQSLGYFLVAGAWVPYKRFDLAIAACEQLGRRLIVAGSGPCEARLRRMAGPHTELIVAPSDARLRGLLQGADALLFPGVEDFGMVAIEAMASGTPVIAFRKGGALDFVVPGLSGEFFTEPSSASLAAVLASFDPGRYPLAGLLQHARQFSKEAFLENMRRELASSEEVRKRDAQPRL